MNEIAFRLASRIFDQRLIGNQYRSAFIEAMIEPHLAVAEWRYVGDGWSGWDFERTDGSRLELKQSAAQQTWSVNRNLRTRGVFDIAPRTGYFYDGGPKYEPHADDGSLLLSITSPEDASMAGINDNTTVTYRVDRKPAREARLVFRPTTRPCFAPQPVQFIKSLFGAETLTIRAAPYNESHVVADFNVSELEAAIKPLREACRCSAHNLIGAQSPHGPGCEAMRL